MRLEPRARVGEVLDAKYCIEEFLGGGAMGNVFRARHVKVGRDFAIKMLHDQLRADPKIQLRFAREAELAAKLRHPNVVGVIDICEVDNDAYMVMDFAPGHTLAQLIAASAPFAHDRAVAIIRQLLDGLDHAHGIGLIHRDLKPDNIIVEHTGDREIPRIVDFGIAILRENAATRDSGRLTTDGLVLGTPHFMAPELSTGRSFDHRADLFALGVICFEMLTGRMPFDGSGVDVAIANMGTTTPAMGVRVPSVQVDPLLESFTRKLMAKRPDERFATAAAARNVLDLIQRDPKAAAHELSSTTLPRRPSGSNSPVVLADTTRIPTPEERAALGSAETQAIETLTQPVVPRRKKLLLAAGITAGALAMAAVMVLGRTQRPAAMSNQAAPATTAEVRRPQASSAPVAAVPAPAPEPAAPPAAPPEAAPPPAPPLPAPTRRASSKQLRAEVAAATATPELTANDVAALYGTVGRKLKAKGSQPGVDALWQRYRTIKIQTSLATEADRTRTHKLLSELLASVDRL
ncbi:MAG TPA: serine/threonine-protein kinase [Kofleriaceae bacterium]